jgi:two-component system, NarL family, response regulator LiaR
MNATNNKLTVAIVDDHQVVRQGLRTFLELYDDIVVVGEAADGAAGLELVRREQPEVVLMDLVMPGMDGITATRQLKALGVATRVIALTSFAEDNKIFPAIQAGAASYLLKDVTPDALVDAIRAVWHGEPRLHPDVARKLLDAMRATPDLARHDPDRGDLSQRELDVVRLVAEGLSNREIAGRLVISDKTVKTHLTHILSKLNLADRTQLAIYALRTGIARIPDGPPASP